MDYKSMEQAVSGLSTAIDQKFASFDAQMTELKNALSVAPQTKKMEIDYKAFKDFVAFGKAAAPALTTTPANAGAVALTSYEGNDILDVIKDRSVILGKMRHIDVSGSTGLSVPVFKTTLNPGVVAENGAIPLDNTTVDMVEIKLQKISSKTSFSLEMLNAYQPFSLYQEVAGQAVAEISDKAGASATAAILGDTAVPTTTTAAPTKITYTDLCDLMASVPGVVENGDEAFFMNRSTFFKIVAEFGTASGYVQMPLSAGMPFTLIGKPVYFLPEMDGIAATKSTVIYGNLPMGARYVTAGGVQTLRDEYTSAGNGLINLYANLLCGAGVVRPDAMAILKQHA